MSSPQKVVLLACGSFNPPTNMHLRMFELARDQLQRDGIYDVVEGIMSPVGDRYNKKDLAPAWHRCNMVDLAVRSSSWIRLDSWESEQPTWLETEKVLSHHKHILENKTNICAEMTPAKNRPEKFLTDDVGIYNPQREKIKQDEESVQIKFLCGGDVLESFSVPGLWTDQDIEKIVSNYGIVCRIRSGSDPRKFIYESDILTKHQENINIVTDWIQNEISSTDIRRALRRGDSVKYLLQDSVIEYIQGHGLYGCISDRLREKDAS